MRLSVALLVLFAANNASEEHKTTPRADERVRILKEKIKSDLRSKNGIKIQPIDEPNEFLSYEEDNSPITPIMESDERKKDGKFHFKSLKTTTTIATKTREPTDKGLRQGFSYTQRGPASAPVSTPVDIFYRKSFPAVDMNQPIPWLHCTEMITPYLTQAKKQLTKPTVKTTKDHVVLRLIQLITIDTTDFNKEEVYSILYQISRLTIRLFSWDVDALNMLFKVITKEHPEQTHSFRSLKSGLKKLFDAWRLDRSNTTRLLVQARVFRPPCLGGEHKGSSRFVPGSTLTPPKTIKTTNDDDSGEGCQNRAHDHGD